MRVQWLPTAVKDLERFREFIRPHNPEAAHKAVATIRSAVAAIKANPGIGRPVEDLFFFHDIVIPFGAHSYILRYRVGKDTIFIVALRHGREVGFRGE